MNSRARNFIGSVSLKGDNGTRYRSPRTCDKSCDVNYVRFKKRAIKNEWIGFQAASIILEENLILTAQASIAQYSRGVGGV